MAILGSSPTFYHFNSPSQNQKNHQSSSPIHIEIQISYLRIWVSLIYSSLIHFFLTFQKILNLIPHWTISFFSVCPSFLSLSLLFIIDSIQNYQRFNKFNQYPSIIFINMISIRQLLTDFFVKSNRLQITAQKIRQSIAENPYFQVASVFERFDKFRKGYLVPSDFSQFMLQNKVYPTESQLYLIYRDFDQARLGVVTLDKFEQQILPKENRKLKKDALQRQPYIVQARLSLDLQFLLARYMENKMSNIKQLNLIRDKLKVLKAYSVEEAFTYVDQNKIGYISNIKEVDNFLRKNGKALSTEELSRIFRYFSFQTNQQITYQRFRDHIDPFALGFYPGYAQKVSEKEAQQYNFLQKKLSVDRQRANNIEKQVMLEHQISNLRNSNRRLNDILEEQEFSLNAERRLRYPYY